MHTDRELPRAGQASAPEVLAITTAIKKLLPGPSFSASNSASWEESLTPWWETQMEFKAHGFNLDQPLPVWPFEERTSRWRNVCVFPFLLVTLPFKQKNEIKKKQLGMFMFHVRVDGSKTQLPS